MGCINNDNDLVNVLVKLPLLGPCILAMACSCQCQHIICLEYIYISESMYVGDIARSRAKMVESSA